MTEQTQPTEEELKKKAFLEGMKLMRAGMDREVIYARLEKQGIPEEIINHAIQNLFIQKKVEQVKELTPFYNVALFRIAIGLVLALIWYMFNPYEYIIPIGLIGGGIISAIMLRNQMDKK